MIQPGSSLGHYEIVAALGKGGMGEVWRARDTKLGREVAIKTLPPEFAEDTDRLARFEREARLLASLNHPNIAAIYGLEEHAGSRFIVLELVEGETLGDRLRQGALPLDEALRLAIQIAEALKAAHETGVIHRDLKPDNIKVAADGNVKVLDFGLAKAVDCDAAQASAANSPTLSMAATRAGVILGTAAYMSPEQAKGLAADRRTDVWAFGCVLFEMLAGKQSFGRSDVTESMGAVITLDPVWEALPPDLDQRLRQILKRCLEKNVRERYQDIGDVRLDLETVLNTNRGNDPSPSVATQGLSRRALLGWSSGTLAAAGLGTVMGWSLTRRPFESPTSGYSDLVSLSYAPPDGTIFDSSMNQPFAVAPDGSAIAVVAIDPSDGTRALWLRPLGSDAYRRLPGTEGARSPFWSPESDWIGFYAPGELKRIRPSGEGASTIQDIASGPTINATTASWGASGVVLYKSGRLESGLERVSFRGGVSSTATTLGPDENVHRFPKFLENSDRFIYIANKAGGQRIELRSLSDDTPQLLLTFDSSVTGAHIAYAPGYLFTIRSDNVLLVYQFDEQNGAVDPNPRRLLDEIPISGPSIAPLSVSRRVLAFRRDPAGYETILRWFGRDGNPIADAVPEAARYRGFSTSPDGNSIAYVRVADDGAVDLFVRDERGETRRPTSANAFKPRWSADGARVAYGDSGPPNLHVDDLEPTSSPVRLTNDSATVHYPTGWSPDGNSIVYEISTADGTMDLAISRIDEARSEPLFMNTDRSESGGAMSPNEQWIAWTTDFSGSNEIWIANYPSGDNRRQVGPGSDPQWRDDSRELFYVSEDHRISGVTIDADGNPGTVEPLVPLVDAVGLFDPRTDTYSVTADGQRFLVGIRADTRQAPLQVIVNWERLLGE